MQLIPEMTYRFSIRGPLASTAGSPRGERQYWEMTAGTLSGERINATIAMPGSDWYVTGNDSFGRADVRVPLVTDDGAVILLHYRGLIQTTPAFTAAAENDAPTRWDDQYMRFAFEFDTGAQKYAWLNQSIFIARGHLLGTNELEYEIYRLT